MMRRTVTLSVVAALLFAGSFAGPAEAGKKKKSVSGSFTATLAPFPKLAAWGDPAGLTRPGCSSGQQDVHWVAHEFKPPFSGSLHYYSEGFTGDWDIYVFDGDFAIAKGEEAQVNTGDPTAPAPPEEEIGIDLKKGQVVTLVLCNWLGTPEASAAFHFTQK